MKRLLLFAALLLAGSSGAATIAGTTCPGSGCSVSYVAGTPALAVSISGTWSGTIAVELSMDGATYVPTQARPTGEGSYSSTFTGTGGWNIITAGWDYIRFRATAWGSGTAVITTRPAPAVVAPDITRVVGPTYGKVLVSGEVTSTLTPESVAAIGPAPCTLRVSDWVSVGSSSPTAVPADLPDGGTGALLGRTGLLIVNTSSNTDVSCGPASADGGTPLWGTRGTPIFANGGSAEFEARDSVRIYCRARTGSGVSVSPTEKACAR